MKRWRIYRNVDCPCCRVVWELAPARHLRGDWQIWCPTCSQRQGPIDWRARL